MDGYSYFDIFETKGIEYLAIIFFLAMLIPFWMVLNRRVKINQRIQKAFGVLSVARLKIPQGVFYAKNHTWTHLERSGVAKVGLDDLLLHITGEVKFNMQKKAGDIINKGDLLTDIDQQGKVLRIFSPISGKIMHINSMLNESPDIINEDPFGQGWIYKIKPSNWKAETNAYFLAEEATIWSTKELQRFKDFLATSVQKYSTQQSLILQDGGELRNNTLAELPANVWQDFQQSFLNE